MKYFLYMLAFVMCCINCVAQTYIEPVFDRADYPEYLHINKIEVTKDTTFVYCTYTAEAGSWARISKETYLYDHDKKKKYTILKCSGLPFSPQQRDFRFEESVQIVFCFPSIGNAIRLDFVEDPNNEAFNIYGINVKEHYENSYKRTDWEHFSRMSSLFDNSGNDSLAIQYKKKQIESSGYIEGIKSVSYLYALTDLCKIFYKYGYHQDAIKTGEKVANMFETLQIKTSKYGELLSNLSTIYSNNDNYEKAIEKQEQACLIFEETSDWLSLSESLNAMGNIYHDKRNTNKAEQYVRKALDLLNRHDKAEEYVKNEIEQSGNYLLNSSEYYKVVNDRILIDKISFHETLSRILREKGNLKEAIKIEKECVSFLNELSDIDLYIVHLSSLSLLYQKNGQFEEAIELDEQCLNFWESRGQKKETAVAKYNIAICYFEKGDTIRAIEYAHDAVLTSRDVGDKLELAVGLGFLSILYWNRSQYREAENCLSEVLDYIQIMLQSQMKEMTSEQKQRIWNKYRNYFILYRDIVYKGEKDERKLSKLYDYVLFSKSLLLDSEIYGEDRLSTRLNVTWKDIQKKLSDDDIAIEFIATIDERTDTMQYGAYHALVIDKDCQYPKMITLIHDKGVENSTEHVSQLWNPILDQYKEVKNIYFSPDGVMHGLPIENLYVDNIGFLSDKYNMYRLSSTKELVKQHEKVNIKSAVLFGGLTFSNVDVPDLAMYEREQANLFRGIKERGGFDPLNYTFIEVKDIKDILEDEKIKTSMYTREKGTEEIFKELSGKKINLIHLATHGMYVDTEDLEIKRNENNFGFLEFYNGKDPVREDVSLTHSFLVMSGGNMLVQREIVPSGMNDGILTAKEISKMDLAGLDLVVLSACETAHGEITVSDGIWGLHRGFKKAGANTILMSTSKVDDEATTILMIEFYKNLMLGKSKLKSLKDAQKYLREFDNGKYIDPKYWRPFIMLDGLD